LSTRVACMNMLVATTALSPRSNSEWNLPYTFGSPTKEYHDDWIVATAFQIFYFLSILVIFSSLLKNKNSPMKVSPEVPYWCLLTSLAMNIFTSFLAVIFAFFNVLQATVRTNSVILLMLQSIFQMLAFVVTFLVFYRLLSVYLHIATGSSRPLFVDILHYYILAIVATVSIVRSVLYSIALAQNVNQGFSPFTLTYLNISASQEIIIWMAALELFACITYVLVKSGDLSVSRRNGLAFLFLGSLFFFVQHFFYAVISISLNLEDGETPTSVVAAVPSAVWTICTLGMYISLLRCCQKVSRKTLSRS